MDTVTTQYLREIFNEMERSLFVINGSIVLKIKELEIKQNISNRFIFKAALQITLEERKDL